MTHFIYECFPVKFLKQKTGVLSHHWKPEWQQTKLLSQRNLRRHHLRECGTFEPFKILRRSFRWDLSATLWVGIRTMSLFQFWRQWARSLVFISRKNQNDNPWWYDIQLQQFSSIWTYRCVRLSIPSLKRHKFGARNSRRLLGLLTKMFTIKTVIDKKIDWQLSNMRKPFVFIDTFKMHIYSMCHPLSSRLYN